MFPEILRSLFNQANFLKPVVNRIMEARGNALLVGGCVRDMLLGITPSDFDIEVFNMTLEKLNSVLQEFGEVTSIEKDCVLKMEIDGKPIDFALPRREKKTGEGHGDFEFEVDPNMSYHDATKRRDLTINSILYDLYIGIIDCHDGIIDLNNRVLRHTSDRFNEDPLRVLRIMQFASRFGFTIASETLEKCIMLKYQMPTISSERVFGEFKKMVTGKYPSLGLKFLRDCQWISYFKALSDMIELKQDPKHHPEGDVFNHICHCLDALVSMPDYQALDIERQLIVWFGVLCHDFGKATTIDQDLKTPGHELESGAITEKFLNDIKCPKHYIKPIISLGRWHMYHVHLNGKITTSSVKRLLSKLQDGGTNITEWGLVCKADRAGRPPLNNQTPDIDKILELSKDLHIASKNVIDPIVMGRDLLEIGYTQGPILGKTLKNIYESQLDEEFETKEQAIDMLRKGAFKWQVESTT